MRGTVAKRIRREAVERFHMTPTRYHVKWYTKNVTTKEGAVEERRTGRGTLYLTGIRNEYRNMKRQYNLKRKEVSRCQAPKM